MFIHNFKYIFKTLIKKKSLIFWTFAFPILLGIFFNLAFSDIEKNEKLDIIDIAIVDNIDYKNIENNIYKETFKNLSDKSNKDRLFNIDYVSEEKAKDLLDDKKICGYIIFDKSNPIIYINSNGINETILKYTIDEISSIKDMVINVSNNNFNNYGLIYKNIIDRVNSSKTNIKDISNKNMSYTMIEFYTLIAMACLYGGMIGMSAINVTLANMSHKGKRISVSPTKKIQIILSSVLASYIIQIIGVLILLLFTIFVLNIDYGNNILSIIIMILTGSFSGLTLGVAVSTLLNSNENAKTGVIIAFTMFCSFLSGMMGITMKYVIDKNVPIINKINPAAMITDGFYSLYYYNSLDRFYFNIISLLIFSIIMILISSINLRRKKYDSI